LFGACRSRIAEHGEERAWRLSFTGATFYILGMTAPSVPELSDRAREIFRAVVDGYVATGAPVGSKTIASASGLNLSPASIRNVMQELEERGLLSSPHVSAGRMPTDRGLRLFVDGMMQALEPSAEERAALEVGIGPSIGGARGPVEQALAATTAALSGLSACAGLVMVAKQEARLRSIGFVPLGDAQAMAVLVSEDGAVENRVIALSGAMTSSALVEAGNYMSATLSGLTLAEARARIERELADGRAAIQGAARDLVERGIAEWSEDGDRRPGLSVRGQSRLIDEGAAADLDRVRELLDDLEGKQEVAGLLEAARAGDATRIFIGAENKLFALSGSSVIARPFRGLDGRVVGVVGVIGPTRLNYARVVPMVDFTAATLARLMGH
jgi:heat-inducible transcriptional repressor